jgi:hypothetical protein
MLTTIAQDKEEASACASLSVEALRAALKQCKGEVQVQMRGLVVVRNTQRDDSLSG